MFSSFSLLLFNIFLILICGKFELKQTIWPDNTVDQFSYYGNSVAISENYVVVGAEYFHIPDVIQHNDNKTGAAYIYKYNPDTDEYIISAGSVAGENRLQPDLSNQNFLPGTFSSEIRIANNPDRILISAPYTDIKKDFLKDVPIFDETLQKAWTEEEKMVNDGEYYREIGTMYIYTHDETTGDLWKENVVSYPNEIMFLGGYGRVLGASKGLNKFAGAYFNKLRPGMGIPPTLGEVFVSYFDNDNKVQMYQPIRPFTELKDIDTQRFGAQLKFADQDKIFIVVLDQSENPVNYAGTYLYQLNDKNEWVKKKKVEFKGESEFKTYATSIDIRSDSQLNNLLVMSATNKNKSNSIIFVSADSDKEKEPQQIIDTGSNSPSYFEFCGDYLAVTFKEDVTIYKINIENKKYELYQTITDPKILGKGQEDLDYSTLGITFPGHFAWESTHCKKFVVGANSGKNGGLDRESKPYGRAYVFELKDDQVLDGGDGNSNNNNKGGNTNVGLIVGCTVVAVVVVVIIIVVVVIVVRRNKRKNNSESEA